MRRLVWALLWLATPGCSRGGGGNSSDGPAIAAGTYSVSPPLCASTGASPSYPDFAHKAALLDFADLTEHSWTISDTGVAEVLKDADCALTIQRRSFINEGSRFSLDRSRTHTFEPETCTFTVANLGVVVELGHANGAPFEDQADTAEDLPFDVVAAADKLELKTVDVAGLSDLWDTYGCADPDRLALTLAPEAPALRR